MSSPTTEQEIRVLELSARCIRAEAAKIEAEAYLIQAQARKLAAETGIRKLGTPWPLIAAGVALYTSLTAGGLWAMHVLCVR